MRFEALTRLERKTERFLMYPSQFPLDTEDKGTESRLPRKARDEYNVKLVPIKVQSRDCGDCMYFEVQITPCVCIRTNKDQATWAESYTNLLAFNKTHYDRVLSFDPDTTMLQTTDELFLLPCPVALPRAYWLNPDDQVLSSQLLLIKPS
ncbi:hypothetical protein N7499_000661 [Penicillium canescens]|nr:hypothetical protein N7499_000661 [Penicillium canescens]KAJ6173489.1 hypothetical protein N7485_006301 [Penicillium canescens]